MKHRFSEYYCNKFENYEQFKKETNNVLYIEEDDGQIKMNFVDQKQLGKYGDYLVITTWVCNFNLHIVLKKEEI